MSQPTASWPQLSILGSTSSGATVTVKPWCSDCPSLAAFPASHPAPRQTADPGAQWGFSPVGLPHVFGYVSLWFAAWKHCPRGQSSLWADWCPPQAAGRGLCHPALGRLQQSRSPETVVPSPEPLLFSSDALEQDHPVWALRRPLHSGEFFPVQLHPLEMAGLC